MTDTKFKRGQPRPKGAGRKKGTPNKYTDLKTAYLKAFEESGGVEELVRWIEKSSRNRGIFYQMITKLFPVSMEHSGAITFELSEKYMPEENNESK